MICVLWEVWNAQLTWTQVRSVEQLEGESDFLSWTSLQTVLLQAIL